MGLLWGLLVGLALAQSPQIKIAVVDTGFDFKSFWPKKPEYLPKMCGRYDAITDSYNSSVEDTYGHGTPVIGLIAEYLNTRGVDYCIYIIKWYTGTKITDINVYRNAMIQVLKVKPDIVNMSFSGDEKAFDIECSLISLIIEDGTTVVASLGNDGRNLYGKKHYPVMCDHRVYKIANVDQYGKLSMKSNYIDPAPKGDRYVKELGTNLLSIYPNNSYGYASGTSFSAALVTAKLAEKKYKERRK